MKLQFIKYIALSWFALSVFASCKKFLDAKPEQRTSTPDTLDDLQALLDNQWFYRFGVISTQNCSDEYYLPFSVWQTRKDLDRLGYIWDAALDNETDWTRQYGLILTANTVLDRVDEVPGSPSQRADQIKGAALFLRSHCFYQLAQLYAPQFDSATATSDMGIVLRLQADFNIPSTRSSVKQTYDQVIGDLKTAIALLPNNTAARTRPGKEAATALLARVYLQVGDYVNARLAAESCLSMYNTLIDYNDASEVNTNLSEPFINKGIRNKEILYYINEDGSLNAVNTSAKIDSVLFNSYDTTDLRRAAFFRQNTPENTYRFKGSYNGSSSVGAFTGVGTAEVYLIKAECNARLGNISTAMQDLNSLLVKRYKPGKVPVFNPASPEECLNIVLKERKKEMVYRGVRWADLKRLNKKPATAVTLTRNLNGNMYTLPPNDLRYTLLIPRIVMQQTNLAQNPR